MKDFSDTVQAIANDPDGSVSLEAATYEDGNKNIRARFEFSSKDARIARAHIEDHMAMLEHRERAEHRRVFMVFTRSDVHNVDIGKRSGERVKIEELSDKPLALMYASELAEERIKHEIRDADDNIYKKGFVVDVNVRLRDGKPVAYAVTHCHDIIDLPDVD